MIYFISDAHFNHSNIINHTHRHYLSIGEMNEALIVNWNKVIRHNDTVICLGDMFYRGDLKHNQEISRRLNGKKILIRGNHDGKYPELYKLGFIFIAEQLIMKIAGQEVLISHYPYKPNLWYRFKSFILGRHWKHMDKRPKDNGLWLLHGHTHDKRKIHDNRKMINLCVEAWDFKPVSIKEIEQIIQRGY